MKDIMKENYMFDTENITSISKNMIVVCYDISDNSIRSWRVLAKDDDNIRIYKINGSGDVTVYGNAQVLEDEEIIII